MTQKSKLSTWCEGLLEVSWLAAVILSPLFFNIHSDRVFEPDKLTLIRSLAVFMLAVWLVAFVDRQGWLNLGRLRWSDEASLWKVPFVLPTAAIALAYLISTIFSVTPSVSWFGSYQRLQGTYTTLSYIIIFLLIIASMRSERQVRRVVTTVIIVSIPVALYGMMQHYEQLDPLPWGGDTSFRIAGHMGNSIFVGAYLIMAVPLTLARIIGSFTSILSDEELNMADIIRSSIYIFVVAIQLIAIYWTRSRGPLLGLGIGIFAFISIFLVALRNTIGEKERFGGRDIAMAAFAAILAVVALLVAVAVRPSAGEMSSFLLFIASLGAITISIFVLIALRQGWKWLWLSWLLLSFVVGLWLVVFNLAGDLVGRVGNVPVVGNVVQTLEAWRELPAVGRYGRLLESDSSTGKVRVLIWEGTVDLMSPHEPIVYPDGTQDRFNLIRPLIGYGPESMYVAYNRFYPPELATVEARNASPDRAHNETWDALVITGILGFLAWQWLYLSVFYYGFKWLGVVQSRQDRNIFIGLWIATALIFSLAFTAWRGLEFLGVALPFGSIIGLVLYLVYYALFARPSEETVSVDPFRPDRLLMISLIGAVVAHYVEIHFGIAIAASRTHFFVYIGLMLVMGYILPRVKTAEAAPEANLSSKVSVQRGKRLRRRVSGSRGGSEWLGPILIWTFVLGLIVAILGYNFSVYTPPPGTVLETIDDVPTATEIFKQSFFVNPLNNFADSPFVYALVILTWGLGVLIVLSEMVKNGSLKLPAAPALGRERSVALIFFVMAALAAALFLITMFGSEAGASQTQLVGRLALTPLGALLCVYAGLALLSNPNGRQTATAVAVAGIAMVLPITIAGGDLISLFIGAAALVALYFLWDGAVRQLALPALVVSVGALIIGFGYSLLHASQLRASMLTPAGITQDTAEALRRVAEAEQFSGILTFFYIFLFVMVLGFGAAAALNAMRRTETMLTWPGIGAFIVLLPLAFYLIHSSNLEVIQADMIYKRGKPFDSQAPRMEDPAQSLQLWDNAIAIYRDALDKVPQEDFYYLWLGRAYLERSSLLSEDVAERNETLETAEKSLFNAQSINPLNTDHTANLARLNTRWAAVVDGAEQENRIARAQDYYLAAISLSPQNAVIRNEYARSTYAFTQDCDESLALYEQSLSADPFYARTHFEMAEIYIQCALTNEGWNTDATYAAIEDQIAEGTQLALDKPGREAAALAAQIPRSWVQAGQFFQQQGATDRAIAALEEARRYPSDQIPEWNIDYLLAEAYAAAGDTAVAQQIAERALQTAPPNAVNQIQQLINTLAADSGG